MTSSRMNCRSFVIGSAAGGMALSFGVPFGTPDALAQGGRDQFGENLTPNELGIWVADQAG